MTASLATVVATNNAPAIVQEFSILPEVETRKPRLYLGTQEGAPSVFYAWDSNTNSRQFQQATRFTGMLTGVEVRSFESEAYGTSHKLVTSFALEQGGTEIEIVVGTGTYCALTLVAALSGLNEAQLKGMIGISGKAGSKGVVFLSVFADGNRVANEEAVESLKEARTKGNQHEAVSQMVDAIQAALTA